MKYNFRLLYFTPCQQCFMNIYLYIYIEIYNHIQMTHQIAWDMSSEKLVLSLILNFSKPSFGLSLSFPVCLFSRYFSQVFGISSSSFVLWKNFSESSPNCHCKVFYASICSLKECYCLLHFPFPYSLSLKYFDTSYRTDSFPFVFIVEYGSWSLLIQKCSLIKR